MNTAHNRDGRVRDGHDRRPVRPGTDKVGRAAIGLAREGA